MRNKILIVDDSQAWVLSHMNMIKQLYGDLFEIYTANSAKDALNVIKDNKQEPFNIILTDLQMETDYDPKLAGEWLVENIKNLKYCFNSKVVIISSMYNIEFIAKKYNVDCISKNTLVNNNLLLKLLFEKQMPFLAHI